MTEDDIKLDAQDQVEDMEHYITHEATGMNGESTGTYTIRDTGYWRCFQCGELFHAHQEEAARKHFGALPPAMPACWFGKDQLITLLRVYEEQNRHLLETIGSLIEELGDREDAA